MSSNENEECKESLESPDPALTSFKRFSDGINLSVQERYFLLCQQNGVKPHTFVLHAFPDEGCMCSAVSELDFASTYLGPNGIKTVLDLCPHLSSLRHLSFRDNYVTNQIVQDLCQLAFSHPSLESIDLSNNQFISWTGGMYLLQLASGNKRIVDINLQFTSVNKNIVESIFTQSRKNAASIFLANGSALNPSLHPTAIFLRSMKGWFDELSIDGKLDSFHLVDGFREKERILGKSSDPLYFTDVFSSALCSRATGPMVTWEEFTVCLLLEGSTYDPAKEKLLQRVFAEFNLSLGAKRLLSGVIQASDCARILRRINGFPPKREVVECCLSILGLDNFMTMNWDEFFFIFYPRAPQEGYRTIGVINTDMPGPRSVVHN